MIAAEDSAALSHPPVTVLDPPTQAMPRGGVAFYNCGPQSGRSQPHKHLQVGVGGRRCLEQGRREAMPRDATCAGQAPTRSAAVPAAAMRAYGLVPRPGSADPA